MSVPGPGWRPLRELGELQARKSWQWAEREIRCALVEPDQLDLIVLGCGGGNHRYCDLTVYRRGDRKQRALALSGNCDECTKPRLWLSTGATFPRQLLTYHAFNLRGEKPEPGFWVWSWDGSQYQPARPQRQGLFSGREILMGITDRVPQLLNRHHGWSEVALSRYGSILRALRGPPRFFRLSEGRSQQLGHLLAEVGGLVELAAFGQHGQRVDELSGPG